MTTTLLERGNVKDAILGVEQMSGCMTSRPRRNGATSGADGVYVLEIICRNGIRVHAMTVSDAKPASASSVSNTWGAVWPALWALFAMGGGPRPDRASSVGRGSGQVLRDSTFSYFEVDELGAVTWRTEMEAVVARA